MTLQFLTIITAAGGMALVALSYNAYPVYFMFASLVAVVIVSYVISRLSAQGLGWSRETSDRVFENDPITVLLQLTNRSRLPRFSLAVRDTLPPLLETDQPLDFTLPALWPRERISISYQARARKRGVYPLGPLSVWVSDPFGIFQRQATLEARGEAIVYPRPIELDGTLGRSALGARGATTGERARAYEAGLDFYGVRDYQPGDELRRIHWPATAHHNRLTVVEFERGASENLAVLLDTRAGSEFGTGVDTTLEVGVRVAASVIRWALVSDATGFIAADSAKGPQSLSVERPDQEYQALELLARVTAGGSLPISGLLKWVVPRLPSAGSVYVVTAAPDEELPEAVASLVRRHIRVAAILLDAHSFDVRASHTTEMADLLLAAGAATVGVRRGDDLREALEGVLLASE